MYHSITFYRSGDSLELANTYDDFCLVPDGIPVISPPSTKKQTIDIPGSNGVLDLTESLLKYPVYNNRQGSVSFNVLNDRKKIGDITWADLYSRIMNTIHGRRTLAVLDDDPNWYYRGRWDVSEWTPSNSGAWPILKLDYDLEPYKNRRTTETFEYSIPSTSALTNIATYRIADIGNGPIVSPEITTTSTNTTIKVINSTIGYSYEKTFSNAGTHSDAAVVLYSYNNSAVTVYAKGSGTVKIKIRERSL